MNALRAMYGLRRVSLAVTSLLLSASTIHLLNLPSEPAGLHLTQGLHDLQAMSINHPFAARCVDIIRGLASKWKITLPEDAVSVIRLRNLAQRPRGSPVSSTFFAASIERQESTESGKTRGSSVSSGPRDSAFQPPPQPPMSFPNFYCEPQTTLDATQSENAFWTPFPLQGVPLASQDFNSLMFEISQMDAANPHQQPWPVFGGSAGPPSSTGMSFLNTSNNDR